MALVMIGFIFNGGSCNPGGQDQRFRNPEIVLAKAGSQAVYYEIFATTADRRSSERAGGEEGVEPKDEAKDLAFIARQMANRAVVADMASKRGISVSDQDREKAREKEVDGQILQYKFQLISAGSLKPEASEAEFADAVKATTGRSVDEWKQQIAGKFTENLKDPAIRDGIDFSILSEKLMEAYKKETKVTDDDLKKGFETYTFKRVHAEIIDMKTGQALKPEEQEAKRQKIEKALAEVKGGLPFEEAVRKYSEDPLPKGKTDKAEQTVDLAYSNLTFDASYGPLNKMKVGDVSPLIMTSTGPAIFKLYKVSPKVPADFEKVKDSVREGRIREVATRKLYDDSVEQMKKLTYESTLFKALVEWSESMSKPDLLADPAARKKLIQASLDSIKDIGADQKMEPRYLTLALHGMFEDLWPLLTAAEQKAAETQRIEYFANALEIAPSVSGYRDLAKLRLSMGDMAGAAESLKRSIDTNAGVSPHSIELYKSQVALRGQLAAKGLAADQLKLLDDGLNAWKASVFEEVKLAAESNADYTELGEEAYNAVKKRIADYEKGGLISAQQAAEARKSAETWKTGLFDGLKQQAEANLDYSDSGQRIFIELNARIDKYAKAGFISASQQQQLQALQAKWRTEKKKYDEEMAKNAPKPEEKPKPGASGPPAPGGSKPPSSSDLGVPTTGGTSGTGR